MVANTLSGTLIIESGGQVSGTTARVGSDNVTGTVTVRDANSAWTNTGTISIGVGSSGFGFLNILNGGSVSNTNGQVGDNAGGTGTVTVSGSGSQWTNSQTLVVGWYGNGTVTIDNGGAVSAPTTWMGVVPGAQGTLTLSGTAGNRGVLTTALMAKGLGDGRTGNATLNLNGGILRASADKINFLADQAVYRYGFAPGDVVIGTGGAFIDSNGHNIGISAVLGGPGGLTKLGAGTLTLSGANTYAGGTTISDGILVANTTSLKGPVLNNAVLVFNQPVDGTFSGNISGSGSLTKDGAGALTLAGTNTYTGGTQVNGGTLVIAAPDALGSGPVTFGGGVLRFDYTGSLDRPITVSSGGFTVDTNGNTQTMSAPLAGSGPFTKTGPGGLNLTGNSPLSGPTSVQAGHLAVNGSLANSTVTVQNGATLGGNGTIGGLTLNGTLSPGNSIGTITIAGNATFAPGSTTVMEVSSVAADRIIITGTASLAGGLTLVPLGTGFVFGTRYTLLSAAGGLSGQFATVTTAGSFGVTSRISYSATDVVLSLAPNALQPLLPAGTPANPVNVAGGIDRAVAGGANPSAFMPLFLQSPGTIAASLNTLSGEAATGTQTAALNASSVFLNLMLDPMVGSRGATASAAGPSLIEMADPPAGSGRPMPATAGGWALWTKAFGQSGRIDGDAGTGAVATSGSLYGVAAGADLRLTPDTVVGFALAGGGTAFGINGRGGGSGDLFQLGLYGSTRLGEGYVSAALAYGWNGFDIKRNVNLAGPEVYSSRLTAQTYGGRIEAGRRFPGQTSGLPAFGWTPYAALEAIGYSAPAYAETAGGAFALSYGSKTSSWLRTELGLRLDGHARFDNGDLLTFGRLAWAYQASTDRSIDAQFQTLSNSAFTVFGARPSMHTAIITVGAELKLAGGVRLSSTLEGELGSRHQAIRGNMGLRYEW